VKDPVVKNYWRKFERKDARTRAEVVAPIENKLNQFLLTPRLRNILGQVKNRVDVRRVMDRGQILIVNLSKGKMGGAGANLLGSLLVTQFQIAAMSRADIREDKRRDFNLYIDEFHSFVTESFASILSEARKYRLCLTLAHQYFEQIDPVILAALTGNAGTLIAFRVGHSDAEPVERAFGREYVAHQFTSLNHGEICARLLQRGRDHGPYFGRTFPLSDFVYGRSDRIVRNSRKYYGVKQEIVERRISDWIDRIAPDSPGFRPKRNRG